MSERRVARLEAAAALLALGWPAERIALALTISRASVERLLPAPPFSVPASPILSGCCRRDPLGYYCDAPTGPGEVFCVQHTHGVVWAS